MRICNRRAYIYAHNAFCPVLLYSSGSLCMFAWGYSHLLFIGWASCLVSLRMCCLQGCHLSKPGSIYQDTVINNKCVPSLRRNCFPVPVIACVVIRKVP